MAVQEALPRPGRLQVFGPLGSRNYLLYWLGMVASVLGQMVLMGGQAWLIYQITGSAAYLGLLGLVTAVPTILLNLVGGALADRVNQRILLIVTQSLAMALMLILGTLTLFDLVEVWHVLAIAAVSGAINAFDNPTRMAIFPRLIDRSQMLNAVALNSSVWNGARIVGPTVAGILIGWVNVASCFYFSALGYLAMALATTAIRMAPQNRGPSARLSHQMREGIVFIARNRLFLALMGMTFFNSLFGMSYVFLLPVFAKDILQVGPQGFGYLQTASGVGALAMSLGAPLLGRFPWRGLLILAGALLFGVFLILFAYSSVFALSLALVALVGTFGALYQVLTMTSIQLLVPDALRGRVMGVWGMTWSLMPLGALQGGFVAEAVSAPFAVMVGGLAVGGYALALALASPTVRSLRGTPPRPASAPGAL